MYESDSLRAIQPFELKQGIEELVREAKPEFNNKQVSDRTAWIYSLTIGAARKEAIASLLEFRTENLSPLELLKEKHKSKRLGKHLNACGFIKPDADYEAHAIVSGKHLHARAARQILVKYRIRVDDPDNGVWLPNFKRNTPHPKYPQAPAHRTLHTQTYYVNVTALLDSSVSHVEARQTLKRIGDRLLNNRFPYQNEEKINLRNW